MAVTDVSKTSYAARRYKNKMILFSKDKIYFFRGIFSFGDRLSRGVLLCSCYVVKSYFARSCLRALLTVFNFECFGMTKKNSVC